MLQDDEEEDLGIIPNRIKALRKERNMTVEQLAERSGYSTGHINNVENHKKGFTAKSLKKIAAALGVRPVDVLDTSNAWQEAPVFGIAGPKGIVRAAGENGPEKPQRVRIPLALGEAVAVIVEGQNLYPRYDEGAIVVCAKTPIEPAKAIGRECLVTLSNGIGMIRRLGKGSQDDTYTLTAHNEPPMLDQDVLTCRPVIVVLPSE